MNTPGSNESEAGTLAELAGHEAGVDLHSHFRREKLKNTFYTKRGKGFAIGDNQKGCFEHGFLVGIRTYHPVLKIEIYTSLI